MEIQMAGGLLMCIFLLLGMLHFYWALGGKWALERSLPTNRDGHRVLNPGPINCTIVGIGLLFFAVFYAVKMGVLGLHFPKWLMVYGGWIIPSIFLLRTIGDFKYVGVFKKVKTTLFAKTDSKLIIPLCTVLAVLGYSLQWLSKIV